MFGRKVLVALADVELIGRNKYLMRAAMGELTGWRVNF